MSGAIIGVGATRGVKAVKWEVAREMMGAWIFTIPIAFVVSWCGYMIGCPCIPSAPVNGRWVSQQG